MTRGAACRSISAPPVPGVCRVRTTRSAASCTGASRTPIRIRASSDTAATIRQRPDVAERAVQQLDGRPRRRHRQAGLVFPGTAGRRLGRRSQPGTPPDSHARAARPALRQVDQPGDHPRRRAGRRDHRRRRRRHVRRRAADRPVPVGAAVPVRRPQHQHARRRRQDREDQCEPRQTVQEGRRQDRRLLSQHPRALADRVSPWARTRSTFPSTISA